MSLNTQTISSLREQLSAGDISPADILDSLAENISKSDVGAYLGHDLDCAKHEATSVDLTKPLGGIPIGIKDNINVNGQPCSCASSFLENAYRAPYDATVIRKLREAGAIPFGRMNMDEFAMGSTTENSALGKTINPHDVCRAPGGSSGGSAAAVASNTAIATLGSDTGGSIRQPASHCGVVGLKPSYGRISRYGLVAFASSLDQIGPLTRSVEDAALVLNAIAGHDSADSTSLKQDVPDFTEGLSDGIQGMKLGLPKEYFGDGIHPAVREKIDHTVKGLNSAGAEIVEISLPHTEYAVATYYILATAEASSNLSRFDGIRYGNRVENPDDVLDLYRRSRAQGFGPEVKRRIILGTYVLSSGYYDAYYNRAQKVRTLIRQDFLNAYEKVDAIISPVSPNAAPLLGADKDNPLQQYLADIYTISANIAGICGISVPCGAITSETGSNLPVGLQILGPSMGEQSLLRVARAAEVIQQS
jgi:aspartyl-tRNA(Asn)/glutamyl-tRNA(Gln) amidotransferase subunit A